MDLTPHLKTALLGAINGITSYESDTFSWSQEAKNFGIDPQDVLAQLITNILFDEEGNPGSVIDGVTLGCIRDSVEDNNLPDGHD
jgi:hypothetical protein